MSQLMLRRRQTAISGANPRRRSVTRRASTEARCCEFGRHRTDATALASRHSNRELAAALWQELLSDHTLGHAVLVEDAVAPVDSAGQSVTSG